jgi:hypothetical protein
MFHYDLTKPQQIGYWTGNHQRLIWGLDWTVGYCMDEMQLGASVIVGFVVEIVLIEQSLQMF